LAGHDAWAKTGIAATLATKNMPPLRVAHREIRENMSVSLG
jgi:hypothetical protein